MFRAIALTLRDTLMFCAIVLTLRDTLMFRAIALTVRDTVPKRLTLCRLETLAREGSPCFL